MALTQVDQGMLGTNAQYTGFKNRLINGAMVIDQRNAGASVTLSGTAQYATDRFASFKDTAGATCTAQQSSTVPNGGFTKSLLWTTTTGATAAANDDACTRQFIEGFNFADLGFGTATAQSLTLSFWARSSITGTYGISLANSAANRCYMATYSISVANTWEQKTITVVGDTSGTWLTDNGIGLRIFWDMGSGTSRSIAASSVWGASYGTGLTGGVKISANTGATFYITGVQLEKGSTATSFDYRPYSAELAMCQRYFQKCDSYSGAANTTTNFIGLFTLQQTMRTTPSIGQTGVVYISDYVANDIVQSSASASVINTGGGGTAMVCYLFNYSGMTAFKIYFSRMINSNTVTFSAEL